MPDNNKFSQTEDQYFLLKGQLATGRITQEQFEAALKQLTLQDSQGRYWAIGVDTGKWNVFDGKSWVEAVPPSMDSKPTTLPEQFKSPTPSRGPNLKWIPLVGCFAVVCIALLMALTFATGQGLITVGLAPAASLAPTPGLPTARALTTPTPALVLSNVPGVQAVPVPTAVPPVQTARNFASLNALLAQKIAALNQAELKVIRSLRALADAKRTTGLALPVFQALPQTEQDLKDLAAKAMDVAILADQLGEMSGKQDKGSQNAAQSAEAYYAIARNAYALVIDSQTIRQALPTLKNGTAALTQAIDTITAYGAQLWNNNVTDGSTKGNPFSAQTKNGGEAPSTLNPNAASQVQSQTNANNSSIWIAQSSTQTTKTINVPPAQSPVSNPFDPKVLNALTTAEGQGDGSKAQQVAAANLQKLGATTNSTNPSKPSQLQVPISSVAVADNSQIRSGNLPTFPSGSATVVSRNSQGDENPFMNSFGLNGDQPPTDQGRTNVQDQPPLVNLNIANIVITNLNQRPKGSGSFEAEANFSFAVNWSTPIAAPQFNIACVSNNNQTITQASGTLNLKGNSLMILFPGTVDVYCYASSPNGQTLGSASVNVLVGDAAQATVRVQQVETDSANLNATLTADARNTVSAEQTQAAATARVLATQHALETEVSGTKTAEFKLTAAAFATKQAQPPPPSSTPSRTPTFIPKVVDQLTHPGNVEAVSTKVVLQRGRLYRFTFSGRVNVINPSRSLTAGQLPDRVNGIAVPPSGVIVIEGTGGVAAITCGHEVPDPKDPGAYSIVVEDLGPS